MDSFYNAVYATLPVINSSNDRNPDQISQ